MKFKKNDVVYEVKDPAHISAFKAAGWQELTEPKQEKADVENPEPKGEPIKANVKNSVETVKKAKNAKPKRAKA